MIIKDVWRALAFRRETAWLVTSSHGVWEVTTNERTWVPYSVAHAREVGEPETVCGQYAVGWQFFWDLTFEPGRPGACESCADIVRDAVSEPGPSVNREPGSDEAR